MTVRNFWLDAEIDGRKTTLEGGPRRRDGGFTLTVYIRDDGGIKRAVRMSGQATHDGRLVLECEAGDKGDGNPEGSGVLITDVRRPGWFRIETQR
jgi:hypothetical protein